jgi:hypothetical protein
MKWEDDSDGVWSDADNWLGPVPNAYHHDANFTTALSAPRTVTVDGAFTVGSVNFDSAIGYTLEGAGTITLDDSYSSRISVASGTHTIDAPLYIPRDLLLSVAAGAELQLKRKTTFADVSFVKKSDAGTVKLHAGIAGGTLDISNGLVFCVANGSDSGASRIKYLKLTGPSGEPMAGTLDLNDNDLVITAGTLVEVSDAIVHARNGGEWDQTGITSTAARTHPSGATTLGLLSGEEYHAVYGPDEPFAGFAVAGSDKLVKYTWYGDTDFNGSVDGDDYARIDSGFNFGLGGWLNGDSDLNGFVDVDDYALIDLAFNVQNETLRMAVNFISGDDRTIDMHRSPSLRRVLEHFDRFGVGYGQSFLSAVPEPSAIAALVTVSLSALARRRRVSHGAGDFFESSPVSVHWN